MPASKLTRVRSDGFSNKQRHHAARQERLAKPLAELGLEVAGDREDSIDFGGSQIGDRDKVTHRGGAVGIRERRSETPIARQVRCVGRLLDRRRRGYRSPSWACSTVRFIAGNSRSTTLCVQLINSRRSRHALTSGAPSIDSSMPIITPDHAHLANQVALLLQSLTTARERLRRVAVAFSSRLSLLDHLERRDAGPRRDRIAAERRRVHARPQARGDLGGR